MNVMNYNSVLWKTSNLIKIVLTSNLIKTVLNCSPNATTPGGLSAFKSHGITMDSKKTG